LRLVHGKILVFYLRLRPAVLLSRAAASMEDNLMVDEELQKEMERLRLENDALKKAYSKGLSLRVSEKGAVSVYGLGRFPVTLYKEQWLRLLDMAENIQAFIKDNDAQLRTKSKQS